ncbi:GNAT family N-acetyltransferase [Paenibacillus doosanensis]|uniref:Acetyltransferase (GNAT) family protein n=1 Tax=Paenibacillus konkukensis TaxID=2020716 RepID=A0ABY4RZY7_9BACL|nr:MULTISPECIES: GNAT family N-acetyltransferase [Paenibacillus]MCS7458641.1 GNAT family N-acetyltransferase [Paenibacillus doosanensis]UQZ86834.1 Acetyltransferase (GNAT) family protein [Paenibacillus konkukensis]
MRFSVRFAKQHDFENVAGGDQSISAQLLAYKLANEEIVLAEMNRELIGYLRLEHLWGKSPYIGLIIVRPDCQKQGVGRGMLQFLEDRLRSKGQSALYSSSQVNEKEPQEWHRRMGFRECGIISGINEGDVGELFFVKAL